MSTAIPPMAPPGSYSGQLLEDALFQVKRVIVGQDRLVERAVMTIDKAAAAELKKGLALIELGQQEAGIASLRHVIQRYPKSNEALQARDRLRKLGVATAGTEARRPQ